MKTSPDVVFACQVRLHLRGFTLVETTLALGVVAFALISLVGLMQVGLEAHRNSMSLSIGTRITQTIEGEIRRGETPATTGFRHFDVDGNEVASGAEEVLYTVNIIINPDFILPADAAAGSRDLTRVVIEVVRNPARAGLTRDGQGRVTGLESSNVRTFGLHVAL